MRLIAINQWALRTAEEELDPAREDLRSTLGDIDHPADDARRTVDALKRREQSALDSLEELVLAERPPAEIQAQAEQVAGIHHELIDARVDVREAEAVADREQAQADRAARDLEDAGSGKPRIVAEAVEWQPPAEQDLRPVDLNGRLD